MIKKFALLATMAALFVACGGSNTETMEQQAARVADSLAAQSLLDKAAADAEAAAAAAAAAVDTTAAAAEGAMEEVKEAVK